MKKLLQINSVVNIGSTGRIVEEIGQLAIQNDWESYIAYGRMNGVSKSILVKIGTELDIRFHGLQTRLFDNHGLGSKKATIKLIEQIIKIGPDIIHIHNLHGYYLNIKLLFEQLTSVSIPVVWTFHDCWPITGHCAYFDFAGCERWKTECYNCPQKNVYPASFGFDHSKQNYHLKKELFTSLQNSTLVPVSNWLNGIIKKSFLKQLSFQVINNGINTDVFQPNHNPFIRNKYKLNDKLIILGVASTWSIRKGLKDFIELRSKLDSDFQIILVGLDEDQIKLLPDKIIGISKTESVQELALYYSSADIFVNPTWEDNFPTTNLEALACGTPVITYNTGGSPEAINEDTGFIVEKGDIQGLIHAINIIKDRGKSSYSAACRDRAEKLYDKNDRYMDYIKIYESILIKQGTHCSIEETQYHKV